MCDFIVTPLLTAVGASGAAASAATALQTVGLVASVAGPMIMGIQQNQASQAYARDLERQRRDELALAATREERVRVKWRQAMSDQRAELDARGLDLASPTAVYLGQNAAREMTYEQQSVRSQGYAKSNELSASAAAARAKGRLALFGGFTNAAGAYLTGAPEVWPELVK